MTRKIGIIGLGHVGATLAHSMILKHTCDHLVLIDTNEKKVKADALDFCDTVANTGYPVHITVNDYAALKDADVVVSTLGNIELQANNTDDRFAELPFTSKQVVQVARDLKASGFSGVLLVVTNPGRCRYSTLSTIYWPSKRAGDWDRDFIGYSSDEACSR